MRKVFLCLSLAFTACVPKIYLIDRQTVLEDEAAGEWPQFEKSLVPRAQQKSPTPKAKVGESERQRRLFKVLNGEVVGQNPAADKVEAK